jgi:phosphomannomutase
MTITVDPAIFKAYDVRAIYPTQIGGEVARRVGRAFVEYLGGAPRRIAVGRDVRLSSPEIAGGFIEGARSEGAEITDIGVVGTDMMYFHVASQDLDGGAIITASHNPKEYNGIKMVRRGALPLSGDAGIKEIKEAIMAGLFADKGTKEGRIVQRTISDEYADHCLRFIDAARVPRIKVVLDTGNGMGAIGASAIFKRLPLELVKMYFELDGTFPNHEANPLEPENLRDLQAAVVEHDADLGLAFDGDADRCFVIDEHGDPVSPSAITALVGLREVERERAAGRTPTVIHNLITSQVVPDLLKAAGATTVRTRVGHSFIKAEMAQNDAVFGGEHSAHYYFRDFFFADTGMLAAMHVLAALGGQPHPLSALSEQFQPYSASGEINSRVTDVAAARARVVEAYVTQQGAGPVQVDELDGLTVSHWDGHPQWWFNLRASNTEPLLRLNVEAADEDIMEKVRDDVLALVRQDGEG